MGRLAAITLAILAMYFVVDANKSPARQPLPAPAQLQSDMTLISHAGSGLPDGAYSNSLQALDLAVANTLKLIEIDLSWTADGKLVLLHDWNRELGLWFDPPLLYKLQRNFARRNLPMTEAQFLALSMRSNLTQMTLEALTEWLKQHPDVRIVTDIKLDNAAALALIAESYPAAVQRIVPQIYSFEEYEPVRSLGYADIVFTGYQSDATIAEVIEFAATNPLMAITLPQRRLTSDGLSKFADVQTPLWTHTVNGLHRRSAAAAQILVNEC